MAFLRTACGVDVALCLPGIMRGAAAFSLFLRERVGVRGSSRTALANAGPHAVSTGIALRRSQDPLTPTLSRREREKAVRASHRRRGR